MQRQYVKYVVAPRSWGWVILFSGRSIGCFHNRKKALKQALRDARFVRTQGHDTEVSVQKRDGRLRRVPLHVSFREAA